MTKSDRTIQSVCFRQPMLVFSVGAILLTFSACTTLVDMEQRGTEALGQDNFGSAVSYYTQAYFVQEQITATQLAEYLESVRMDSGRSFTEVLDANLDDIWAQYQYLGGNDFLAKAAFNTVLHQDDPESDLRTFIVDFESSVLAMYQDSLAYFEGDEYTDVSSLSEDEFVHRMEQHYQKSGHDTFAVYASFTEEIFRRSQHSSSAPEYFRDLSQASEREFPNIIRPRS